jgi:hypothetical protein
MNPYLLSDNTYTCKKIGNKFQNLGIRVPRNSVTNPYKLVLVKNLDATMKYSLALTDMNKGVPIIIYNPQNKIELDSIIFSLQQSNVIDGSKYYFNVDCNIDHLFVNKNRQTIISIDLNPFKKIFKHKYDQFLTELFKASRNILS